VRAYSEADEEALRARKLLKDWAGEGFLTDTQYERMKQETVCELRCTNVFLRIVLFLFTLIIVGAGVGLFFAVFLSRPSSETSGFFLLMFAGLCYAGVEVAASQYRLYRYGIEEALAACSVGFLCAGVQLFFFSRDIFSSQEKGIECVVPVAGILLSVWIWHRFGLLLTFLAAMVLAVWLPNFWTSSHPGQHVIVAGFYLASLIAVAVARSPHRFDYLDGLYSISEALLWFGSYLAINLQLSTVNPFGRWWFGSRDTSEFSGPFYWTTWVLIWCLPPVVLMRGLRVKDRFVIAVGLIVAILTLATNKPYLGWERHTWDPILLGVLLAGVALYVRRWLAEGANGIRNGFTAQRLSGKDKEWMNVGSAALGILAPQSVAAGSQAGKPEVQFGGGDSAGGGASSDY